MNTLAKIARFIRPGAFLRRIYLEPLFFYIGGAGTILFILSYWDDAIFYKWIPIKQDVLFAIAQFVVVAPFVMVFIDIAIQSLISPRIRSKRLLPKVLSLHDPNRVRIWIKNESPIMVSFKVVDELPKQLQERDFQYFITVLGNSERELPYHIRPHMRGAYHFGKVHLYMRTFLRFASLRKTMELQENIKVFPSILQMKKLELMAFSSLRLNYGVSRIRRLGHSYEFETIKNYVPGDDPRSINWRASSRKAELMVNQYEDEHSQNIYMLIDKSRSMLMPFDQLSLLDYSINSSLAISNVVIKKKDKAGLITFSDKMETFLKASNQAVQRNKILNALYNEKEGDKESNYPLLYQNIKKFVTQRSLFFLFSNFESYPAAERVMPLLRKLNRAHVLVVVFFENTGVKDISQQNCVNIFDIYKQTIARKLLYEKERIMHEMRMHGIQVLFTKPEDLSVNTLNKYLELKSRGMI